MMKPPQYRVSDVLYMHRQTLQDTIQFVRDGLPLLHWEDNPVLSGIVPQLQMVGSYTFGNAKLRSDMDFNLAFPDWNTQVAARRLYYIPAFRKKFGAYLERHNLDTGMRIDIGCVDAETDKYNIHLNCDSMMLHFRFDPDLDFYNPGSLTPAGIVARTESQPPIDVMAFDPLKDTPPPVHDIHLKLDNYAFRWLPTINTFKSFNSSWAVDEYANTQEPYKSLYGTRYNDYTLVDGKLIPI